MKKIFNFNQFNLYESVFENLSQDQINDNIEKINSVIEDCKKMKEVLNSLNKDEFEELIEIIGKQPSPKKLNDALIISIKMFASDEISNIYLKLLEDVKISLKKGEELEDSENNFYSSDALISKTAEVLKISEEEVKIAFETLKRGTKKLKELNDQRTTSNDDPWGEDSGISDAEKMRIAFGD